MSCLSLHCLFLTFYYHYHSTTTTTTTTTTTNNNNLYLPSKTENRLHQENELLRVVLEN